MPVRCPKTQILEQLLLGHVAAAEADDLEAHVSHCPHCGQEMSRLRADDPLVDAMRQFRDAEASPDEDVIAAMIPWLKRLRPHEGTQTLAGAPAESTETISGTYDFLHAAQDAQEMGRLGPYSVLRPLGAGGMGMVFLARDLRLQRNIALKVIRPELMSRTDVRDRFLRETQAIAAIEHENIVSIFHVDEDRGVPFLAMPMLRGQTLEERLRQGPLSINETLRIGREIAAGLAAAHDRGLIHRDIKPGNIFLEESARVKILDFGLAQALHGERSEQGKIFGTPAYMAPEQVQGDAVDARADLFSLGCVLYRMTTGKAPFVGRDMINVLIEVATAKPTPARQLNPEIPRAFSNLIERLLAKRPEDRPPSAQAVVTALDVIERRRQPGRMRWLFAAAAVALVAVGLTGWLMSLGERAAPRPAQVTFDFDAADARIVLQGQQAKQTIDVRQQKTLKLPPGVYTLSPVVALDERRLMPDTVIVQTGEIQSFPLRLIGAVRRHNLHVDPVRAVAFTAGNAILSASDDSSIVLWNALANSDPTELGRHEGPVLALAVSRDNKWAASGGAGRTRGTDRVLRLWNLSAMAKDEPPLLLPGHESSLTCLAFSPDGRQVLVGGTDGSVVLWDIATRSAVKRFTGHERLMMHAVAFSEDGKHALSAGADKQVIVWDVATGLPTQKLLGHTNTVTGAAFRGGHREVISASWDGTVRLWNVSTGSCEAVPVDAEVGCLALAADGKRVVLGGVKNRAGIVPVWDVENRKEICSFPAHQGGVLSVALSADGRYAASGGADGAVRLWELPN